MIPNYSKISSNHRVINVHTLLILIVLYLKQKNKTVRSFKLVGVYIDSVTRMLNRMVNRLYFIPYIFIK